MSKLGEALLLAKARRELPTPSDRRAIRKAAGVSQGDVAEILGIARPTVTRWETGSRTPRGKAAVRYARLLEKLRGEGSLTALDVASAVGAPTISGVLEVSWRADGDEDRYRRLVLILFRGGASASPSAYRSVTGARRQGATVRFPRPADSPPGGAVQ